MIKEYREKENIITNIEIRELWRFCPKFDLLTMLQKVEIYRNILWKTQGEDLKHVLWMKSPNSEVWLERRTMYTRTLATMSMVGYILGLGDRHPSNLMIEQSSGRVVHIDFGDCFEVTMKRAKFPEKIPFRLTRMLVKAMEASGINGHFRHTCEIVMNVLRQNKDSLMAVLEAFVYDPLLNWRLVTKEEDSAPVESKVIEEEETPQSEQETPKEKGTLSLAMKVMYAGVRDLIEEEMSERKEQFDAMSLSKSLEKQKRAK